MPYPTCAKVGCVEEIGVHRHGSAGVAAFSRDAGSGTMIVEIHVGRCRMDPIDPTNGGSLVAAARLVEALMLGRIAVAVAVLAVAGLGVLMLQGRVRPRRASQVALGCFVLFGAPSIAAGLIGLISDGPDRIAVPDEPSLVSPVPVAPPPAAGYDPYAGASVPTR